MSTNNRSRTATLRPSVVATAAALATLAAFAFLLLPPAASNASPTKGPVVSTASTSLGRILVDARGHTLYLFEKDKNGMSACAGKCATNWPPLIATGKPRAAAGAVQSKLGTTRRADGRMQAPTTATRSTRSSRTRRRVRPTGRTWMPSAASGT